MSLTLSVEGLNRTKRLILLQVRGNTSSLNAFKLEHVFFLLLDPNWNISSSFGLKPAGTWTVTYTVVSWVSSWPDADPGTCQPPWSYEPNPYSKSLTWSHSISLSILYIYYIYNTHIHLQIRYVPLFIYLGLLGRGHANLYLDLFLSIWCWLMNF